MSVANGAGCLVVVSPGGAIRPAFGSGGTSFDVSSSPPTGSGSPAALITAITTPLLSWAISDPQPRTWKGFPTFASGTGSWTWRRLSGAGSGFGLHTFGLGVGVRVGVGLSTGVGVAVTPASDVGLGKRMTIVRSASLPPPQAIASAAKAAARIAPTGHTYLSFTGIDSYNAGGCMA